MMNSTTRAEEQKESRCGHHISSLNKHLNGFRWWCPLPWPRAKGIGRLSDGCRLALVQIAAIVSFLNRRSSCGTVPVPPAGGHHRSSTHRS